MTDQYLFDLWLSLEVSKGKRHKEILEELNAELGTSHRHNWFSKRKGVAFERADAETRSYMLKAVLPSMLSEFDVTLSEKQIERFVKNIS